MGEIFITMGLHHSSTPVRQLEFESTDGWVKLFKIQRCGFQRSQGIGPTENKQVGYTIAVYRNFAHKQGSIFTGA